MKKIDKACDKARDKDEVTQKRMKNEPEAVRKGVGDTKIPESLEAAKPQQNFVESFVASFVEKCPNRREESTKLTTKLATKVRGIEDTGAWTFSDALELKTIHVSAQGSDDNPGARDMPVATLYRAAELAREDAGSAAIDILLAGGTYYLPTPLTLTPADSGTAQSPVVWRGVEGEVVRIVGGRSLALDWERHEGDIFKATVPADIEMSQLFLNGERQILARYPNYDPSQVIYNGAAPTKERMHNWSDPETACIHGIAEPDWGSAHTVFRRDKNGDLQETIVSTDIMTSGDRGISQTHRFVENVLEELDSPKEWFFDRKTRTLYFQPEDADDLKDGLIEAIDNPYLVRFEGDAAKPVTHVTFCNVQFSGAAPTWRQTQDFLPRGGDIILHRGGAFYMRGTEDCAVEACAFSDLGGNAVFIDGYNRRAIVRDCLIHRVGANGVAVCGSEDSMRGDQFPTRVDEPVLVNGVLSTKLEEPSGFNHVPEDMSPGPKTENYPAQCLVTGNLITLIGELEKQTAGVLLSLTKDNVISRNTVYKVPRAGICMNDCAWSGNIIEHNDIFDTVRETGDHGPFNSWGRERYWLAENHNAEHEDPERLQTYCLIDAQEPNHIRNNRFAHMSVDRPSYGIDLDDGSTNFRIYNNLTIGCGIKMREGMHRIVENNIFVTRKRNNVAKHACMPDNRDVFRKNIVVNTELSTVVQYYMGRPSETLESDRNLFMGTNGAALFRVSGDEREIEEWREFVGQELHSVVADPMFVDPAAGDYRVKPESPALKLGFENFPMEFGVTAPRLLKLLPERALA